MRRTCMCVRVWFLKHIVWCLESTDECLAEIAKYITGLACNVDWCLESTDECLVSPIYNVGVYGGGVSYSH